MSEREDDPWKDIEAELLRNIGYPLVTVADLRADTFVARFFAARAAEATQHQQEIAAKDAIIKQQAADLKVGGEMQDRETAHRLPLEFALSQLRHGYQQLHEHRVSRRGMREFADGIIAPAIRRLEQALASPLSAPPQEPTPGQKRMVIDRIDAKKAK